MIKSFIVALCKRFGIDMELISNFAERIATYRKKNNLTLAALSAQLGVPAQTISRYELSQRTPKVDTVNSIAEKLGCNPLWLQGYDVSMSLENFSEDSELNEYLEQLKTREELRMLFSVTRDATKEDIESAVRIITALRNR